MVHQIHHYRKVKKATKSCSNKYNKFIFCQNFQTLRGDYIVKTANSKDNCTCPQALLTTNTKLNLTKSYVHKYHTETFKLICTFKRLYPLLCNHDAKWLVVTRNKQQSSCGDFPVFSKPSQFSADRVHGF